MHTLADWLSLPWLGTLLSVLGVLAAGLSYHRSRHIRRLAYQFEALTLVASDRTDAYGGIEIRFEGKPVPRVTASQLVLWNAGTRTLRGSDIVELDPLRIELKGEFELLRVRIVKASRRANGFQVSGSPRRPSNSRGLQFDYLDPRDGVWLEILHTGEAESVGVAGTLRGVPAGITDWGHLFRSDVDLAKVPLTYRMRFWFNVLAFGLLGPVLLLVAFFAGQTLPVGPRLLYLFGGALATYVFVQFVVLRLRRFPKALDPRTVAGSET